MALRKKYGGNGGWSWRAKEGEGHRRRGEEFAAVEVSKVRISGLKISLPQRPSLRPPPSSLPPLHAIPEDML